MTDPDVMKIANALARDGYLVCIPEHVSVNPQSRRRLPHLISLYGAGDTVGLPPLALRVWDDLCAVRYLRERAGLGGPSIAVVGLGIGGVDAAIGGGARPADRRLRRRRGNYRPRLGRTGRPDLAHVRPHHAVPAGSGHTVRSPVHYRCDSPTAVAPARSPKTGPTGLSARYKRVASMAEHVYSLEGAGGAVRTGSAKSPCGLEELREWLPLAWRKPRPAASGANAEEYLRSRNNGPISPWRELPACGRQQDRKLEA